MPETEVLDAATPPHQSSASTTRATTVSFAAPLIAELQPDVA